MNFRTPKPEDVLAVIVRVRCPNCDGKGYVDLPSGTASFSSSTARCVSCDGSKQIDWPMPLTEFQKLLNTLTFG